MTTSQVRKDIPELPAHDLSSNRLDLPNNIQFEVTYDMQYLQQYFFIREYAYRLDLGLKNFSGTEDPIDQYSQFIIARMGHFVVAGARLTIIHPNMHKPVPLESDGFILRKLFPVLSQVSYCELGRTAILPQHRNGHRRLFALSYETHKPEGYLYLC